MLSEVRDDESIFERLVVPSAAGLSRDSRPIQCEGLRTGLHTIYGGSVGTAVHKVDPECDSSSAPTSPSADALVSTNRPGSYSPRSSSYPSVYYYSRTPDVSDSYRREQVSQSIVRTYVKAIWMSINVVKRSDYSQAIRVSFPLPD